MLVLREAGCPGAAPRRAGRHLNGLIPRRGSRLQGPARVPGHGHPDLRCPHGRAGGVPRLEAPAASGHPEALAGTEIPLVRRQYSANPKKMEKENKNECVRYVALRSRGRARIRCYAQRWWIETSFRDIIRDALRDGAHCDEGLETRAQAPNASCQFLDRCLARLSLRSVQKLGSDRRLKITAVMHRAHSLFRVILMLFA